MTTKSAWLPWKASGDDFAYTWEYFNALRDFYRRAATANRSVLFSVDQ